MSASEIIPLIISTIGGGVLGAFLTFKISLKKQNLTEFEALINEYKELRDHLQKRVDALEIEQNRLKSVEDKQREEISRLRTQLRANGIKTT